MAKAAKKSIPAKKTKKVATKRATKYEEKLTINASFEDLVKALVTKQPKKK